MDGRNWIEEAETEPSLLVVLAIFNIFSSITPYYAEQGILFKERFLEIHRSGLCRRAAWCRMHA